MNDNLYLNLLRAADYKQLRLRDEDDDLRPARGMVHGLIGGIIGWSIIGGAVYLFMALT